MSSAKAWVPEKNLFAFYCLFKFFSRTVIPFEKVSFNYCRSSGPGGQAVNKQNTKCELRFIVDQAEWLDDYQKIRIKQMYNNKMNKEGELIITAQEHRTQEKNTESAKSNKQLASRNAVMCF